MIELPLVECSNLTTSKRYYSKPLLVPLGDIRGVVLGGSLGRGDSGGGKTYKKRNSTNSIPQDALLQPDGE